jgi:hypothetical protein
VFLAAFAQRQTTIPNHFRGTTVSTSNTVLTPTAILRETYAIMHQQSNVLMKVNRQYDSRFANRSGPYGAIGQELYVRLPAKYTTRTGNQMNAQNYVQRRVRLPLATIYGVDLNFTQEQLTFSINDFSKDVLQPAVSQLTSTVEYNFLADIYKGVASYSGVVTTASTTVFRDFQNGRRYLSDNLAPTMNRYAALDTQSSVDFGDATKGLFQQSNNIAEQYTEGLMGRTAGFTCFENTLLPSHTSGTFTATTLTVTTTSGSPGVYDGTGNAYSNDPFSVNLDNGGSMSAIALKKGDIVTFSNVYEVHPESKQRKGYLKRFTITEDVSGTTTATIKILPVPIAVGAYQNVSAGILDNATMTLLGPATTASAITYGQSLLFQQDFAAFVTADLEDPSQYGAWGAREVLDNLSVRIWRQGDIVNGNFPCRLDIACGWALMYPEWALRWVFQQS